MLQKVGGVHQSHLENNSNRICIIFLLQGFQHLLRDTKTVLMYFRNIVMLYDVINVQKGPCKSSNKIKNINFVWNESYFNTSIHLVNKKKYNSTLRVTY